MIAAAQVKLCAPNFTVNSQQRVVGTVSQYCMAWTRLSTVRMGKSNDLDQNHARNWFQDKVMTRTTYIPMRNSSWKQSSRSRIFAALERGFRCRHAMELKMTATGLTSSDAANRCSKVDEGYRRLRSSRHQSLKAQSLPPS